MTDSQSLGQYRPLAQLGQGGMARVILCARTGPANIQKLLVVKEIREELANDAEFVTMFMDEARLATRMSHPNVVHTFDVGAEGNRYFMVMEYIEGQPMNAVLGRLKRKLPLATHLRILTHVLSGLHYAHELRGFDGKPLSVVHRDVSPQNTILCYDGQVKLVDFGIAKAAGAASRTTAGMFKGKLGYVAPEQIACGDIDRRADIFSVGVMLWEALVGRRLTYGENEAAILHKRTNGTQARVLAARPDADAELGAICDRAMDLDPNQRFASALEMREALEARMQALGLRASDGDIGGLVANAFAEERKGIQAIIERQLALPERTAADTSAVMKLPLVAQENSVSRSSGPPPSSGYLPTSRDSGFHSIDGDPSLTPPTIVGTSTTVASVDVPQFRASKRKVAVIATLLVALGVVAVLVAAATLKGGEQSRTVASAAAPSSGPTSAPVASATNASAVDVSIEVTPALAKIIIDGKDVGRSPFRATVPKDPAEHRLQVAADGFDTQDRTIAFDRDVRLELELRRRGAGTQVVTTPGVVATTVQMPAVAPTAGSDLQVTRKKRNIDESDPY